MALTSNRERNNFEGTPEPLTQEEKEALRVKDPENYEKIMEAYRKYMEIESSLNKREEISRIYTMTLEEKYTFFRELADKYERESSISTGTSALTSTKEQILDRFKEELGKAEIDLGITKINIGGVFLKAWEWYEESEKIKEEGLSFGNASTKFFGWLGKAILGDRLTTLDLQLDGLSAPSLGPVAQVSENIVSTGKEAVSTTTQTIRTMSQNLPQVEEWLDGRTIDEKNEIRNIRRSRSIMYKIGGKLLISLNVEEIEKLYKNSEIPKALNIIRSLSINELLTLNSPEQKAEIFKGLKLSQEDMEILDATINSYISADTDALLKNALKPKSVLHIFDTTKNVWKFFGKTNDSLEIENYKNYKNSGEKRVKEIIALMEKRPDDFYKELTIEEATILYTLSFPALGVLGAYGAKMGLIDLKNDLHKYLYGEENIWDILNESIIPPVVIEAFLEYDQENTLSNDIGYFGGKELISLNDAAVKKKLYPFIETDKNGNKRPIEIQMEGKAVLDKIIDFKDFVYGDGDGNSELLMNPKLQLDDGQRKEIASNLNYKWVVAIYGALGGSKDLDNMNVSNIAVLITTLGNILGAKGGDYTSGKVGYLGSAGLSALLNWYDKYNLTEEESRVLDIYKKRMALTIINAEFNSYFSLIGIPMALGLDIDGAIAATVGTGVGLVGLSTLLFRRFLKTSKGRYLAIGMSILGAGGFLAWEGTRVGGYRVLQKGGFKPGSFLNTLFGFAEKGDIKGIYRSFEKLRGSTTQVDINGEKITFIGYNEESGEVPSEGTAFAVYQGNIRALSLIFDKTDPKRLNSPEFIDELIRGVFPYPNEGLIEIIDNGQKKLVDFSKRRIDGNRIIFGENIPEKGEHEVIYDIKKELDGSWYLGHEKNEEGGEFIRLKQYAPGVHLGLILVGRASPEQ